MAQRSHRRHFLGTLVSTTLGAAAIGGASPLSAMEPLKRQGSKFKFSLAAYSYRKLLTGESPQLTLFEFVDDCARFGLEGTELTSYYFSPEVTDDQLRDLKRHSFLQGLDVSGTAIRNDFGVPPGDKRDREIQHVKKWIDRAEILGAPVIRIFAGHQQKEVSADETHRLIVEGIEDCCEYAGQHGVMLALENHGGPTATVHGLLALARDVKSPWFGVNLDTGNFHSETIYQDLAEAAPYAINVQVKVAISGPDRKKTATNFSRLAEMLEAVNYRGYVVLEYEEGGDPRSESERYLDLLREAFV